MNSRAKLTHDRLMNFHGYDEHKQQNLYRLKLFTNGVGL